jgi:hypothetical protein
MGALQEATPGWLGPGDRGGRKRQAGRAARTLFAGEWEILGMNRRKQREWRRRSGERNRKRGIKSWGTE